MKAKCKDLINITPKTYLINANDCVIENGELKVKRKYGKFKRPVYKINNEEKENNNRNNKQTL